MGSPDGPGAAAGVLVKHPMVSLEVERVESLGEQVSPGVCPRPFNRTWRGTGTAGTRKAQGDQSTAENQWLYSRERKFLAPWLNFIVQLASSQPLQMVLKAEMQSQETEPSNFYPLPLIEVEEDIQSGTFEAFLSHHQV